MWDCNKFEFRVLSTTGLPFKGANLRVGWVYIINNIFFLSQTPNIYVNQINVNFCLTQAIASLCITVLAFSLPNLYATLVCVACSQLEKLRAALLDIRQTHVISEQHCEEHQYTDRQTQVYEEVLHRMRKQLNVCIRHHQDTKRYDRMFNICNLISFYFCRNHKYYTW
jgi:hypothetical protein